MTTGVLHLDSIEARHNALALARVSARALNNSGNAPVTIASVADLSSSELRPTEDEFWTLGYVTIDNVAVEIVSGISFTNTELVSVDVTGPYPRFYYVGKSRPMLRIQSEAIHHLEDFGLDSLAVFGTNTDPPVKATSCEVQLARVNANGLRVADGTGDILIRFNIGQAQCDTVQSNVDGHMTTQVMLYAFDDGNNAGVTFTRNSD